MGFDTTEWMWVGCCKAVFCVNEFDHGDVIVLCCVHALCASDHTVSIHRHQLCGTISHLNWRTMTLAEYCSSLALTYGFLSMPTRSRCLWEDCLRDTLQVDTLVDCRYLNFMKSCCPAAFHTHVTNKFLSTWHTKTYLHMLRWLSAGFYTVTRPTETMLHFQIFPTTVSNILKITDIGHICQSFFHKCNRGTVLAQLAELFR